ncbi:hypothetical protein [Embleya scabrispora]|uniref:hypothetical protein n=1 Tax=Embleya scabrispora TaxID=159449 RepID=UPI00035FA16F|nr:hypothetical protein [Embleya scabrispora]MYS83441.1 hypothetical protein [Streptomyces sp. SID5474]
MKRHITRTAMAGAAALAIASGGLLGLSGTAVAAEVVVPDTCKLPPLAGGQDVTNDQKIELVMPTGAVKPGNVATVGVKMGPTGQKAPAKLNNDFTFSMTFEVGGGGGTTKEVKLEGGGKLVAESGGDVALPQFDGKITIPADLKSDITLKPKEWTTVVKILGDQVTVCKPTGTAPDLGTLKISEDGGGDPPAGAPNGKDVTVDYTCDIYLGSDKFGDPLPLKSTIKVIVPSAAKPNEKVAVQAKFKDDILGTAPSITPANGVEATVTPTLTIDTTGGDKKPFNVALPAKKVSIKPGDQIKAAGPLTGEFTVGAAGDYTFSPGAFNLGLEIPGEQVIKVDLKCKATKTDVSATLKAKGDGGTSSGNVTQTPTGNVGSDGGSTTTNGGATGDLAHTGASGGGMTAFAMAAGTAVLGAIALMLFVPYRRRIRNQV